MKSEMKEIKRKTK